jgi:two-component system chemotaxis response regulator CheB
MSQVKVVRQRFNGASPCRADARRAPPTAIAPGRAEQIEVIGVVASTGGPAAVAQFLQGLGDDFATPILLVQHMGHEFLAGYANWLDSLSDRKVALARNFEVPLPGTVLLAPGRHHLTFAAGQVQLIADRSPSGHVPSGDMLFNSLAKSGPRAAGVLLTGMGEDGARGLLAMREAGAHTIVQDRATSAVYGMPAVAMALGAAEEELPVGAIAGRLTDLVAGSTRTKRAS